MTGLILRRVAYGPLKRGGWCGLLAAAPLVLASLLASGCARAVAVPAPPPGVAGEHADPPFVPAGSRVTPEPEPGRDAALEAAEGEATYYASKFDGRRTASGIVFRNAEAYAAHRTYPFGTVVRVTNLRNDRSVVLRVVDRGPFGSSERARRTIIDVSQSAARELDFMQAGRVPVLVEVLEWGSGKD